MTFKQELAKVTIEHNEIVWEYGEPTVQRIQTPLTSAAISQILDLVEKRIIGEDESMQDSTGNLPDAEFDRRMNKNQLRTHQRKELRRTR